MLKHSRFSLLGLVVCAVTLGSLNASDAHAWGSKGHATICEVAARLVTEPALKSFLSGRTEILGHLCNIPDIAWRQHGEDARTMGDPTHFMNYEKYGVPIKSIPLDFGQASALAMKGNPAGGQQAGGTVWWSANQFYNAAIHAGEKVKASPFPERESEQVVTNKVPYNYYVRQMIKDLGLLGHFVGDASQPFHNTADYDGYDSGHGGIHSYYEGASVNFMSLRLVAKVETRAKNLLAQGTTARSGATILERMRALSAQSLAEIPKVIAADAITAPSTVTVGPDGKSIRGYAKRPEAEQAAAKFEDLATVEMGRAAALLALSWDEIYVAAGRPDLSKYRAFQYLFEPQFVKPDYLKK